MKVLISLLIILYLPVSLHAQSLKPIKIVTLLDFKPFIWCENQVAKGIDIDIVTELFLRVDRDINIQCLPWKRALHQVKHGEADALFSAYRNPKREQFATFLSSPLHTSVFNAFVNQDSHFTYHNVQDFYGKRIGLPRGYSVNDEFDKAKQLNKFMTSEVSSIEAGIRMLLLGRIDIYINGKTAVLNKALEMGADGQIHAMKKSMHSPKPAYFMFSKKARIPYKNKLIRDLNRELSGMWEDGSIQGIITSYTLPENISE